MKKITITITHNLTPFHEKSMTGMLHSMVEAMQIFWSGKSTKKFLVRFEEAEIKDCSHCVCTAACGAGLGHNKK